MTVLRRWRIRSKKKREAWDRICKRCGSCCYERVYRSGELVIKHDRPCNYLDTQSKECTVYTERFKACRECQKLTIFHALFAIYLPDTCGYVEKYGWRKKVQYGRKKGQ